MKSATVVIAHGSREAKANEDFVAFVGALQKKNPKRKIRAAFLELAKPSITETLITCAEEGAQEIFIMPLMLFSGRHVKNDIPRMAQEVKAKYPALDFHYARPLAETPGMVEFMNKQLKGKSTWKKK